MCDENKKPEALTDDQLEGASGGDNYTTHASMLSTMLQSATQFNFTCPHCGYSEAAMIGLMDTPIGRRCPHCKYHMDFTQA